MSKIAAFASELANDVNSVKKIAKFTHATSYDFLSKLYQSPKLNLKQKYPFEDKTKVLDLYPGFSMETIALYETLNPSQHLMIDSHERFNAYNNKHFQLEKQIPSPLKPDGSEFRFLKSQIPIFKNLQHCPLNPYQWSSYSVITNHDIHTNKTINPENAIFLPTVKDRSQLHNEFLIHGNLTGNVCSRYTGEALIMQLYACVHRQNWMQRFGRVRMLFWARESTALKLIARPGEKCRSKASLIADTFTKTRLLAISNESIENPKNKRYVFSKSLVDHHDPVIYTHEEAQIVSEDKERIALIEIEPVEFGPFDFELWDYVTRQLFVLSSHPLSTAISTLGPGAKEWLLPRIPESMHCLKPAELTKEQCFEIYEQFCLWPFRPDVNLDFFDVFQE